MKSLKRAYLCGLFVMVVSATFTGSLKAAPSPREVRKLMEQSGYDVMPSAWIPTLAGQIPCIDAKVGNRRLHCVIDTLRSKSLIRSNLIKHLRQGWVGSERSGTLELSAIEGLKVSQVSLEAANGYSPVYEWRVMSASSLGVGAVRLFGSDYAPNGNAERSSKISWDVVLGADFLVQNRVVLDFGGTQMFVPKHGHGDNSEQSLSARLTSAGFASIGAVSTTGGRFSFLVLLSNQPHLLALATSATESAFSSELLTELPNVSARKDRVIIDVASGSHEVRRTQFDLVQFGPLTFRGLKAPFLSLSDWGIGPTNRAGPRGVLGVDLLTASQALVDCSGSRIFVR